jgi:hypothetical protein
LAYGARVPPQEGSFRNADGLQFGDGMYSDAKKNPPFAPGTKIAAP